MSIEVSGFGLEVRIIAIPTFPTGLVITEFADDADPLDVAPQQIADSAMNINGDLVRWITANGIPMTISVVPDSVDDINLRILAEANRASRGKGVNSDVIDAVLIYPNGTVINLFDGVLQQAPMGTGAAPVGKLKSKTYTFMFQDRTET